MYKHYYNLECIVKSTKPQIVTKYNMYIVRLV